MTVENKTPQDLKREQGLIGTILACPDIAPEVFRVLNNPEMFYAPNNQLVYKAARALYDEGKPTDLYTVYDYLKKKKADFDSMGGITYLMDLAESAVVGDEIVLAYCDVVKEKYIARQAIREAFKMIQAIHSEEENVQDAVSNHETAIANLLSDSVSGGLVHCKDEVENVFAKMEKLRNGDFTETEKEYVKTGISDIDDIYLGFKRGHLIIVAGRPGSGKSAFVTNLLYNISVKEHKPVALFSLEMTKTEVAERIFSAEAEVNNIQVAQGMIRDNEWERIKAVKDEFVKAPIYWEDSNITNASVVKSKLKKLIREQGELGAVILDYIGLMEGGDTTEELDKLSRQFKMMAKELNVPVIILSQLNRAVETRQNKRPQLSDLRMSGQLEANANQVLFLYRDEYYNEDSEFKKIAELNYAKNRGGATGTVKLFFEAKYTKFSSLAKDGTNGY